MKKSIQSSIAALVLALVQSSLHAEMRIFTSSTGTTIRGELDTINGDMVTIKKEDGKSITTKAANFSAADQAYLKEHGPKDSAASSDLASATKDKPFINSLGMKFVPVPGTKVLFCTTFTRVKDWNVYAAETGIIPLKPGADPGDVDMLPACYDWSKWLSWNESKAFCDWLSKKESRMYRLPTDREWSYAVGIGSQESKNATPEELNGKIKDVYPWGNQWPPPNGFGNYSDESFKAFCIKVNYRPLPPIIKGYNDGNLAYSKVEFYKPNRLGLYDMGGNQWQWCEDWYDAAKTKRCARGASGGSYEKSELLSSARLAVPPDHPKGVKDPAGVSFRCVVELPGS